MSDPTKFTKSIPVEKVDEPLGLVFGWAAAFTINGEDHYDLQGDCITEAGMLKAATDFMAAGPELGEMHQEIGKGTIPFVFPLTKDIADAFGITCEKTGLMIGIKPNPDLLAKFVDGTYDSFSIGGLYGETEQVDDE